MIKFNKYNSNIFNFLIEKNKILLPNKKDKCINNIYTNIFYLINDSYNLINNKSFNYDKKNIENIKKYNHSNLLNSNYTPLQIKSFILNNKTTLVSSNININNKIFNVKLFCYKNVSNKKIETYLKNIYSLIIFLLKTHDKICLETLTINIYLTNYKKLLPENVNCILNPNNINSGLTIPCKKNSEILIYREEEWFKVLIHESIHVFGIDFSMIDHLINKDYLKNLFNVNSDFLINETYCETIARLINTAFISYDKINNSKNINICDKVIDFKNNYNKLVNIERFYSIHQMVIILNYHNINYKDLFNSDPLIRTEVYNKYSEKTNIFCYYVLTSILMNNYIDFLKWCNVNNNYIFYFNKNINNIDSFIDLILKNYDNKNLHGIIYNLNKLKLNNKSLKMTCLTL